MIEDKAPRESPITGKRPVKAGRGLVIVHTGDGKGKTTAALGTAVRAVGSGLRVLMLQFIKGSWTYGELKACERLAPDLTVQQLGKGFTWETKDLAADIATAQEGFAYAREQVMSGEYDLVILDEINYAVDYDFIRVEQVLDLIREKPAGVHLILTGRNARPEVIEVADLVTEMRNVKHPFDRGILATRGIEF